MGRLKIECLRPLGKNWWLENGSKEGHNWCELQIAMKGFLMLENGAVIPKEICVNEKPIGEAS